MLCISTASAIHAHKRSDRARMAISQQETCLSSPAPTKTGPWTRADPLVPPPPAGTSSPARHCFRRDSFRASRAALCVRAVPLSPAVFRAPDDAVCCCCRVVFFFFLSIIIIDDATLLFIRTTGVAYRWWTASSRRQCPTRFPR